MKRILRNKKAQVGETLTWVIATVIIVVILLGSVYAVSLIRKSKNWRIGGSNQIIGNADLLATKSLTAYLMTETLEGRVFDRIMGKGDLDEFTAPLSSKVFISHEGNYPKAVWLDIRGKDAMLSAGSERMKYYKDYYEGEESFSYPPTACPIINRVFFDKEPDPQRTKNLVLFLCE